MTSQVGLPFTFRAARETGSSARIPAYSRGSLNGQVRRIGNCGSGDPVSGAASADWVMAAFRTGSVTGSGLCWGAASTVTR
ncbi:hypothetical protein GCM10010521_14350 [Streptomyces rameus]|uniref:Uncharacterized protein n=1 Tax=Streptomyces rameus TaxID=68261 RepID=A0ABP6MX48_9ACTN